MPKYTYTGNGAFFQGLPARDIDSAELDGDGRQLLAVAIEFGLYIPVGEPGMLERTFDELLASEPATTDDSAPPLPAGDDLRKDSHAQGS